MRKLTLALLIAFFSALLLGLHVAIKQQPDPGEIEEFSDTVSAPTRWLGRFAPDFELELLDGSKFHLADHVGKRVVLLNFFATWCQPCREEMPELLRFAGQNSTQPLVMVAVDAGEERKKVESFVSEFKMGIPTGIDRLRAIERRFGVRSYPTTVMIGADGRIGLYENTAILNADVGLKPLVQSQLELVRDGKGISRDAYLAGAAGQNYRDIRPRENDTGIRLTGRAKSIAERMGCLCGCTNKLEDCTCQTATGMKKKLKDGDLGTKTDDEIAKELGREFCLKGM